MSRNCVIPIMCVRTWEMWVVKHNCVTDVYFNDYVLNNYMFRPVMAIVRLPWGKLKNLL